MNEYRAYVTEGIYPYKATERYVFATNIEEAMVELAEDLKKSGAYNEIKVDGLRLEAYDGSNDTTDTWILKVNEEDE